MPEVAINYRVAQSTRTPGSLFKFRIKQRFEISQSNAGNVSEIFIERGCNLQILIQDDGLTVNRQRN